MKVKKLVMGISLLFLVLLALVSSSHIFADDRHGKDHDDRNNPGKHNFNAERELTRSKCNASGNPVIDVTQKVQNDVDSGFGANAYFPGEANYWNVESYTRHIKVWSLSPTTWCAVVAYDGGHFNAFYKQTGPGGTTDLIGSDVNGEMHGGYRSTVFTGTLTPTWPTHGNVGTFNYDCNLHGVCGPNRVDWVAQYFPDYTGFDLAWWGWIYQANDHHGTWINAIDVTQPNSGNIL